MRALVIDLETCSRVNLKTAGTAAYAEDASTAPRCAVFQFQDDFLPTDHFPALHWLPGELLPMEVLMHIETGKPVVAHNHLFELLMLRSCLCARYGWPEPPLSAWHDTAQDAAMLSLPTSLEGYAKALGTPAQKDMEGKALMLELTNPDVTPTEVQLRRLLAYCELDVRATGDLWRRRPRLTALEAGIRLVDRQINVAGVEIDASTAETMRAMAERHQTVLQQRVLGATEGDMLSVSASPIKRWLTDQGVKVPTTKRVRKDKTVHISESLDKDAIVELLAKDLPAPVREVLTCRREAGRLTSLAKLAKVPKVLSGDARWRGALRYCGAHTGRWSSKDLQLHNLPKVRVKEAIWAPRAAAMLQALEARDYPAAVAASPNLLETLSLMLRSIVVARDGHELIGGDYSAIEARIAAWLAGQEDVLDIFRAGGDIYMSDARKAGSEDRQFGKVQRLAFNYGMGAVKAVDAAAGYGIHLSYAQSRDLVATWRANNPMIVQWWADLQNAAHSAVREPGKVFTVGAFIRMGVEHEALRVQLPSGRILCYWRPSLRDSTRLIEVVSAEGVVVEKEVTMTELRFFSEAKDRTSMQSDSTYGGKLAENITQAVARDILGEALVLLARAGYTTVLHVHDSIAAEVPAGTGSVDDFCALAAKVPEWAPGLPLAMEGYRSPRFKG